MSQEGTAITAERSDRPRLLILCRYFQHGFGGVPQAVHLIARSLATHRVNCDVLAGGIFVADVGDFTDLPNALVVTEDTPRRSISTYDSIYIAGAWQPQALPTILVAWWRRIPVVYSPKGQLCAIEFRRPRDLKKVAYLLLIEIWIALMATAIQFTSELERASTWLPASLKLSKGVVVPEPMVRDGMSSMNEAAPRDGYHFGFIAQISPRKGLRELIEGFLLYCDRHPETSSKLTVAGTPVAGSGAYFARARGLLNGHPAAERIRFIGQVSGKARDTFYNGCDVIVIPSLFESFGLIVVEALANGCVALASPHLGVLEFIETEPTILVLREISAEAVADGIAKIESSLQRYREAISTANGWTCCKFAPEKIAAALLQYLLPEWQIGAKAKR
jgi:glycosyltransferase involved in cell wall biosynthesis